MPYAGSVTWTTNHPEILKLNGNYSATVTRPAAGSPDVKVTLTATLTDGRTKTFEVTVIAQELPIPVQTVNKATTAVEMRNALVDTALGLNLVGFNGLSDQEKTDATVTLLKFRPATGFVSTQEIQSFLTKCVNYIQSINSINLSYGGDLTQVMSLDISSFTQRGTGFVQWSSDHPEIFDTSERVLHRPAFDQSPATIQLTATLDFGFTTYAKTYELTILPLEATDQQAVATTSSKLELLYATGDSEQQVKQNLTLPTQGLYGSTVTWSSSNADVISTDGMVHRQHPTIGDQTITLTAHVTRNSVSVDRAFTLTVKALEYTPLDEAWITVVNNKKQAQDSVTVQNTQAGDLINVYATDGATLLAQVTSTGSITTISLAELGHKGGTIYVSNTRAGYVEHSVAKRFPADNGKYHEQKADDKQDIDDNN
ncbi:immunoglobulin-like domain-containing protein [Tumebacillus permanentifrigoris]|uniref:Atrophied bacterial Ig domain-containing protein n=1 Tax=Tumebacillus permanentifrigoris TaxID=378543 RepID=A0A316D6C8_9BACL|nr:immunoglobulin-like domain-containing protein [Tumebacillus permanentifrigoris]PWK10223.1 hypothetical protein C7459_11244 [Tumebacillus permanentifrigoris]